MRIVYYFYLPSASQLFISVQRTEYSSWGFYKIYLIEAIAFSVRKNKKEHYVGTGKNQSDFWKAFAQTISRLNTNSRYGKTDRVVIALPNKYLAGWNNRVEVYGKNIWFRIGKAFPELEIWFVSKKEIQKYKWNDGYFAK